MYTLPMDEGQKRVLGIMAAILASLHAQTADDLFRPPQGSPRTDKVIPLSGAQGIFSESHYLNNGNALVSGIDPELFGEVSLAAGFPIPNQYGSDPVLELLPER